MKHSKFLTLTTLGALVLSLSACTEFTSKSVRPPPPEIATGYAPKAPVSAARFMAVTNNPMATRAAYDVLRAGGSAVDAAIAAQMMLTLTEPQSSGIGGGAFLLHYDRRSGKVTAYEGRETAPQAATEQLFYGGDGKPMTFSRAVVGGRSVGTPGLLRMLALAHKEQGVKPWGALFQSAIDSAQKGFAISPRLANTIASNKFICQDDATAAGYFCQSDGSPKVAGTILQNPELAATFKDIAQNGAEVFYTGKYAQDIVNKVRAHERNPGLLALSDFTQYKPKVREPVCSDYRQYKVCGFPPPSSGGIAVAQILGILQSVPMSAYGPNSPDGNGGQPSAEGIHWFAEASRLAYADRNKYVADADFVPLPSGSPASLIDPAYLASRAALMREDQSLGVAPAGVPEGAQNWSADASPNLPSTTQLTIVDAKGNVVSMTSTIESAFGSMQMVDGFLLNNQLTDFSFVPQDEAGNKVANRVQSGKRPRSSMAPTLVFDKSSGEFVMATGSPGGRMIIEYVAKTLVGVLDWDLNAQQAAALVNFGSANEKETFIEKGRLAEPQATVKALEAMGHKVIFNDQTSGLAVIVKRAGVLVGGADPRREGAALGE